MSYAILAINPGSTSTKVAYFEDENKVFSKTITHAAKDLAAFASLQEQLPYRKEQIAKALYEADIPIEKLDACVGRGGGLLPVSGGIYLIDELLLDHAKRGANGVVHPAQLGPVLAKDFAERTGVAAFVVDPPDTDELQDVARISGVDGLPRRVHLHALNLKVCARRYAKSAGTDYQNLNLIVCHLGGGVSVSAHRAGHMIDGFDIVGGEGPMAPTRAGALSVDSCLRYLETHTKEELLALCHKSGGFVSHLGTSDAQEVKALAEAGDAHAVLVWEAFIYQVEKAIGAMASVLGGKVDAILLTGGLTHAQDLVEHIRKNSAYIGPTYAFPGEFEMEAMAEGALLALTGKEPIKRYSGRPVWTHFS